MPSAPDRTQISEHVLRFGPFELYRTQKILLEHGATVRLGSRALDILIALVERAGEVVSKTELMSYAWPSTCVEESNLRVHVAALRKMLGDGLNGSRYIINVVGRGYSFVAPVSRTQTKVSSPKEDRLPEFRLPPPSTRLLGRQDALTAIAGQVRKRRLVTIVGPAGVGKTTIALALGEQLLEEFGRRVCFVDLAALEDPESVPLTLATLLGISALTEEPLGSIVAALNAARILIILDNCEHVIAAAARMVEVLLRGAPGVTILATSREPLWVSAEQICQLEPLAFPPDNPTLTAERALQFPAVQLFVDRATAGLDSFELTNENASAVARICRRVDGMPLAIELIAARTSLFTVELLANRFGDDLLMIAKGSRGAQARQQSLRGTLDWSYRTLLQSEQTVLRRLSVFRGPFAAEAATAVVADEIVDVHQVLEALMSLAGKSLLIVDVSDRTIRYRLLHVTRVYAAEKLAEAKEQTKLFRAHANHARTVLEAALAQWEGMTREEWLACYGRMIDDVRAALDWAFGSQGDLELGTALTVASLPFGFQLSLIDEFKRRAQRALEGLAEIRPRQPTWESRITNALVNMLHSTGASDDILSTVISRAAKLAEECGDPRRLIEPYTTNSMRLLELGDYSGALVVAEALQGAAVRIEDGLAHLMADRVGAQVHYNAGHFARAQMLAERVLRHPARALPLIYGQLPISRHVSMRNVLARGLWVQGRPDEAEAVIAEAISLADRDGPLSLIQCLGVAGIPIAFWRGDLDTAARRTEDFLEHTRRYTFNRWYKLGLCYQRTLHADMALPGHEVTDVAEPLVPAGALQREILATISAQWLDGPTCRKALKRDCGWSTAELLRLCGEASLSELPIADWASAEARFFAALELARQQQALSWELRIAMSLARLWNQRSRRDEAHALLKSVYDQFTEGHATRDLMAARDLLRDLQTDRTLSTR